MRREFSKKTKLEAWTRSGGNCEACKLPIKGRPEYDHVLPCGLSGDNSLENCAVLCVQCHSSKTHGKDGDRAKMSKADRVRLKHLGIIRPKGTIKSKGFR